MMPGAWTSLKDAYFKPCGRIHWCGWCGCCSRRAAAELLPRPCPAMAAAALGDALPRLPLGASPVCAAQFSIDN